MSYIDQGRLIVDRVYYMEILLSVLLLLFTESNRRTLYDQEINALNGTAWHAVAGVHGK